MKRICSIVAIVVAILKAQQGGADLSPRYVAQDSTPYVLHYAFTGLIPDTVYYVKIRIKPLTGSVYYGHTYNPQTKTWLSQTAPWTDHPAVHTSSTGSLSGWLFGRNARHSPVAQDDSLQTVVRLVGGTTNTNPTVKPLVSILDMATQGGWLYGHLYEDPGFAHPYSNHHVMAFRGSDVIGIYTTEHNGVLEGYDSLNVGYVRFALPIGVTDSLQVRTYGNVRVVSYMKTSPPWTIRPGDSTNIDRVEVDEGRFFVDKQKRITLSPNPGRRVIRINYPGCCHYQVRVYNSLGRVVRRLPEGVNIFYRQGLASGVYFFELKSRDTKEVFSASFID